MNNLEIKPLGVAVNYSVPSSVDEFDSLAKKAGTALMLATRYHLYHVAFSDMRDIILHGQEADEATKTPEIKGLEQLYGTKRKTKQAKDKGDKLIERDGKPVLVYDETEQAYFDRIVAVHDIKPETLKSIVQEIVDQIPFDPSKAERKPAEPKTLPKKYAEAATALLKGGKIVELNKRLEKSIGEMFTPVDTGNAEADFKTNITTLGWIVKRYTEFQEKQTLAKLTA